MFFLGLGEWFEKVIRGAICKRDSCDAREAVIIAVLAINGNSVCGLSLGM